MIESPYYNTNHLKDIALEEAQGNAVNQSVKILLFFKNNPEHNYTPPEVHEIFDINTPLTSVRRSISDLTKEGLLFKTAIQRKGAYGSPNYAWKYRPTQPVSQTELKFDS